jgi:Cdc6-like AAA superfamily ATPase
MDQLRMGRHIAVIALGVVVILNQMVERAPLRQRVGSRRQPHRMEFTKYPDLCARQASRLKGVT